MATERNIYNGFRKLAKMIGPNDNLVIYFSGHGEYDEVLMRLLGYRLMGN